MVINSRLLYGVITHLVPVTFFISQGRMNNSSAARFSEDTPRSTDQGYSRRAGSPPVPGPPTTNNVQVSREGAPLSSR